MGPRMLVTLSFDGQTTAMPIIPDIARFIARRTLFETVILQLLAVGLLGAGHLWFDVGSDVYWPSLAAVLLFPPGAWFAKTIGFNQLRSEFIRQPGAPHNLAMAQQGDDAHLEEAASYYVSVALWVIAVIVGLTGGALLETREDLELELAGFSELSTQVAGLSVIAPPTQPTDTPISATAMAVPVVSTPTPRPALPPTPTPAPSIATPMLPSETPEITSGESPTPTPAVRRVEDDGFSVDGSTAFNCGEKPLTVDIALSLPPDDERKYWIFREDLAYPGRFVPQGPAERHVVNPYLRFTVFRPLCTREYKIRLLECDLDTDSAIYSLAEADPENAYQTLPDGCIVLGDALFQAAFN